MYTTALLLFIWSGGNAHPSDYANWRLARGLAPLDPAAVPASVRAPDPAPIFRRDPPAPYAVPVSAAHGRGGGASVHRSSGPRAPAPRATGGRRR